MAKSKASDVLSEMSPAARKGMLNTLVSALISELNDAEKKEMMKNILGGRKEGKQLESMVEQ